MSLAEAKNLPGFQPLCLSDKERFNQLLSLGPSPVSEFSFSNLFMWNHRYLPVWREWEGCLLVAVQPSPLGLVGFEPAGGGDRKAALSWLCDNLAESAGKATIIRASKGFVTNHVDPAQFQVEEDRDNQDYVYAREDLVNLAGRKFHRKKNHLNKFLKTYAHEYRPLESDLLEAVCQLQNEWCDLRDCSEDEDLLSEDFAIKKALEHFEALDLVGGAILVDGKVEAFSLGERMDAENAVVHIEKGNPLLDGIYAAMNQMFCQNAWQGVTYINREQDLGIEGLRKAKLSYNPHHMIDKFTLTLK